MGKINNMCNVLKLMFFDIYVSKTNLKIVLGKGGIVENYQSIHCYDCKPTSSIQWQSVRIHTHFKASLVV